MLEVLLPKDRVWAWWTRTDTYARAGLPTAPASREVNRLAIAEVVVRRWLWRGHTLALIPPVRPREQGLVRHWAAYDTEQTPDHIWTAPDGIERWDFDAIAAWCSERGAWGDSRTIASQPAERIVTSFDGQIFCATASATAARLLQSLEDLARAWGLGVIAGLPRDAWPATEP